MKEIELRKSKAAELEVFFNFQLDADASYLAAFTPADPTDKTAYLEKYKKLLLNPSVNLRTIIVDGRIAGSISVFEIEGEAEVTYWIDKQFWGRGVATKALQELLKIETKRPIWGGGSPSIISARNGFWKNEVSLS